MSELFWTAKTTNYARKRSGRVEKDELTVQVTDTRPRAGHLPDMP